MAVAIRLQEAVKLHLRSVTMLSLHLGKQHSEKVGILKEPVQGKVRLLYSVFMPYFPEKIPHCFQPLSVREFQHVGSDQMGEESGGIESKRPSPSLSVQKSSI